MGRRKTINMRIIKKPEQRIKELSGKINTSIASRATRSQYEYPWVPGIKRDDEGPPIVRHLFLEAYSEHFPERTGGLLVPVRLEFRNSPSLKSELISSLVTNVLLPKKRLSNYQFSCAIKKWQHNAISNCLAAPVLVGTGASRRCVRLEDEGINEAIGQGLVLRAAKEFSESVSTIQHTEGDLLWMEAKRALKQVRKLCRTGNHSV